MFTVALVRMAMLSIQLAAAAPSGTISTCDLVHPEDFVGKLVRINVVMGFTMHGMYLLSDSCNRTDVQDAVVLFPKTDDTPKVDFDLDPHAVQMLPPFLRPTGGTANACGVLTGQLFYKKNFRSR